jgi:hypothetical protein
MLAGLRSYDRYFYLLLSEEDMSLGGKNKIPFSYGSSQLRLKIYV